MRYAGFALALILVAVGSFSLGRSSAPHQQNMTLEQYLEAIGPEQAKTLQAEQLLRSTRAELATCYSQLNSQPQRNYLLEQQQLELYQNLNSQIQRQEIDRAFRH